MKIRIPQSAPARFQREVKGNEKDLQISLLLYNCWKKLSMRPSLYLFPLGMMLKFFCFRNQIECLRLICCNLPLEIEGLDIMYITPVSCHFSLLPHSLANAEGEFASHHSLVIPYFDYGIQKWIFIGCFRTGCSSLCWRFE